MAKVTGRNDGDSAQPAKRKLGRGLGSLISGAGMMPTSTPPQGGTIRSSSTMAARSQPMPVDSPVDHGRASAAASPAAGSTRPRPGTAGAESAPKADFAAEPHAGSAAEPGVSSGAASDASPSALERSGAPALRSASRDSAEARLPSVSTAPGSATSSAPAAVTARGTAASPGQRVHEIPLGDITPNVHQPRQQIDAGTLKELAESIRAAGIMQPIIVRPRGSGKFELIAGERRWRAAQLLELRTIPALVREVDDRTAAEWALIENVQREDLNPMDRAAAFLRLIEQFGLSHQQIAERVGVDRTSVSNLIRLNELDEATADSVRAGRLTLGHAKALLGCADPVRRAELGATVLRNGWSVRRTEQAIRELNATRPSGSREPSARSLHLADLERRIGDRLGTRVSIETGRATGSGTLRIAYYSIAQFEGLLARMGIDESSLRDE